MKNFEAVRCIYPDAVFSMIDDDINKITWVGTEFPTPTKSQMDAAIAKNEAAQQAILDLKASAKAKLIAGKPLTAEEADTLVL